MRQNAIPRQIILISMTILFLLSLMISVEARTQNDVSTKTSSTNSIFDGKTICIKNPCPRGPHWLCVPNDPAGLSVLADMISDFCKPGKMYWAPHDLPYPSPEMKLKGQTN